MASKECPGAIIIGGTFSSLGAAHNLAEHGVPVYVVDYEICVAQFSRLIKRFFKYPSSKNDSDFIDFLLQLALKEKLSGCVLFPSDDESVRKLAQYRDLLSEHFIVTTPAWEVVKYLYDKRLTYQMAREQGTPIPETYNPRSLDEVSSLKMDFPVVLKPAITSHLMSVTKKKAYRANDQQELIDLYTMLSSVMNPSEILVQELIPGRAENLFSFAGFFKNGLPVAGISARRLRQHPMEFGRASTYVVTVNNPDLERQATKFLQGIAYNGLAEVEFMYDEKDDRLEFLEVNPRIWGWHTIAIRSGLDLPYLAYADSVGQKVTLGPPKEGVKWVRLVTDIPTAALEIFHGRMSLRQYFKSMSGDIEFAILKFKDPLPFIAELFLLPYFIKHRGF